MYKGKTLEISLYLAIKPSELIAKGHKFYMGLWLFSEIFRNLLVTKHLDYGYQFSPS